MATQTVGTRATYQNLKFEREAWLASETIIHILMCRFK